MKAFFICFTLWTFFLQAENTPKLTVGGSALLTKPADQLELRIGVVTQDKVVESALKANNEKMEALLTALKNRGLLDEEIKTGTFMVVPLHAPKSPKSLPDEKPFIIGYEVRNVLNVKTTKLPLVGKLIDIGVKNGANWVDDISFSLVNPQKAQEEAIAKAIEQAYNYANAAAKATGVILGPILEISINPSFISPRVMKANFVEMAQENVTPISPKDVEISASVSLVYQIFNQSF